MYNDLFHYLSGVIIGILIVKFNSFLKPKTILYQLVEYVHGEGIHHATFSNLKEAKTALQDLAKTKNYGAEVALWKIDKRLLQSS